MASIKDLYTRDECNTPQRVNIGKADWIEILGTDSDEFTKAKRQINLDVISKKVSADDITPHLVASLVTAWSFDEECTHANKVDLFKNSPSLCEQVDKAASSRSDFTKKLQAKQSSSPAATSGSKSRSSKARTKK